MRSSRIRPWVAECERLTPWSGDHKSFPCFLVSFSIAWEWDLAFLQSLSRVHCPMRRYYSLRSLMGRKGHFCLTHCCSLKRKVQSVRIGRKLKVIFTNNHFVEARFKLYCLVIKHLYFEIPSLTLLFLLKRLPRMPTNGILLNVSLRWTSIPNREQQWRQLKRLNWIMVGTKYSQCTS